MAMYLSNVIAYNVIVDTPTGTVFAREAKVVVIHFEIPPIALARKKINRGMPKTPIAKSSTD